MMSTVLNPTIEDDCTFALAEPFQLASGEQLQPVTLRYALYGRLNRDRDNAILVCHALSGSARVAEWWPQMFGPDGIFDTEQYCMIGINVIGSCYGSTGPRSSNSRTGERYNSKFPVVRVADMVRAQAEVLNSLGVQRLHTVIGPSIGGMQALRWVVDFPDRVERCVAIGATPLSAMGLALNHLQRQAIRNDPVWSNGNHDADNQPVAGLALARAIAICSYKSPDLFAERFARKPNRNGEDPHSSLEDRYDVAGYLDYQGASFTRRLMPIHTWCCPKPWILSIWLAGTARKQQRSGVYGRGCCWLASRLTGSFRQRTYWRLPSGCKRSGLMSVIESLRHRTATTAFLQRRTGSLRCSGHT